MDSAVAVSEPREGVEAVYRADAERLRRAVYAFAGDAGIASDAVADSTGCGVAGEEGFEPSIP